MELSPLHVIIGRKLKFLQALVMLATVPSQDFISQTITTEQGYLSYGTYQGVGLKCNPFYIIQYPTTLNEVQAIIQEAIRINKTVKAFGSRHSLTDIICTDGIPIDMKEIKHIEINLKANTVTVGSGVEVLGLLNILHLHNSTLIHVPAYGGITIAGAIGTGAHGSSLRHPTTLSDQVVSMVIVDGTGQIRNISDPEDLKAFKVHIGLLGVIYEVTLKIVPQFKLFIVNYPSSDDILFENDAMVKLAEKHDWCQFWWFPKSSSVVISRGQMVPTYIPGNAKTSLISNVKPMPCFLARQILEWAAVTSNPRIFKLLESFTKLSLYEKVPTKDPPFSEDGNTLMNPAVGFGHEMISSRCKTCPWSYGLHVSVFVEEFSVAIDIKEFSGVINSLKELLMDTEAYFPMFGLFFRFSPASNAYLALQQGRKTFHIDWVAPMRLNAFDEPKLGLDILQAIMQTLVYKHGGRPHWGKNGAHYFSLPVLTRVREKDSIEAFIKVMQKYDPNGVFDNEFRRRFLGVCGYSNRRSRQKALRNDKHCALQDNCICETDDDCGSSRRTRCKVFKEFRVCQSSTRAF